MRCPACDTVVHVPELQHPPAANAAETDDPEPNSEDPVDTVPVEATSVEASNASNVAVSETAIEIDAPVDADSAVEPVVATPASQATGKPNDPPPPPSGDDEDAFARPKRDDGELDMTPMVDVTFLLLIFFVVTASFQLQKSILMPRQKTDAPSTAAVEEDPEELDQVELQIDEEGGFLVLSADDEIEPLGKQALVSTLRGARGDAATKLIIKVQEQAILQSLVDGMDSGTIAGYEEIEVTQVEDF